MKIKTQRFILEPTGETRNLQYCDTYIFEGKVQTWINQSPSAGTFSIYRLIPEETDWTPKEGENYYCVSVGDYCDVLDAEWSDSFEYELEYNLAFPHTPEGKALAEARAIEIKRFLEGE